MSQDTPLPSPTPSVITGLSLPGFNKKQSNINKNGMIVLASWAGANIGVGLIGRSQTTGSNMYFHEMNALWNTFNLVFAAGGIWGGKKGVPLGYKESFYRQQRLEKTFLFNAALDAAYITFGALLVEKAKTTSNTKNQLRYDGYGKSLYVQGGFLLLFDSYMLIRHYNHGKELRPLVENIQLGITQNGPGFTYTFN